MLHRRHPKYQHGFTLLELLSVLVIMGVMVSVAIKKFDLLSDTAAVNAIKAGVRELNTRETLVWTQTKLSESGWENDDAVYDAVDKTLGARYRWNPGPTETGGTLHYESESTVLERTKSTRNSVGSWK
jgi:prepilin-type N-terminal cleavage/methylation domain-containing protein